MWCPLSTDWGDVATWVQSIGSIGAILVAVWVWRKQSTLTRETQKAEADLARETQQRSLKPHLWIRRDFKHKGDPHVSIRLINNGLGPAIIQSLEIKIDDAVVVRGPGFSMLEVKNTLKLCATKEKPAYGGGRLPNVSEWIPAGKEMELLMVKIEDPQMFEELFGNGNKAVIEEFRRLSFAITYESVFGDVFTCGRDQDDSFASKA